MRPVLQQSLKQLRLSGLAQSLDVRLAEASGNRLDHAELLTGPSVQRGEGRRFQYTANRVRQRARRLSDRSSAFKARYRWRAGMEGTISRLKHQMGLACLRVRGLAAVTHRVFLRALGLNILRCAAFQAA